LSIEFKLAGFAAEHLDQRVVDDLDDLLARRDRFQDRLANAFSVTSSMKRRATGSATSASSKRDAHFAHRFANVLLVERTATAQAVKDKTPPSRQRQAAPPSLRFLQLKPKFTPLCDLIANHCGAM
jgi:hypothetical protein